jgi:pyruvate dehydrogenase E2 component (dihydrolipoamide acetyltransferase)
VDLIVPQLSSTMETARIVRWLKQRGDTLRLGEPILEVETDKSTMEVESPAEGVLTEVLVGEGDEVAVGGLIGRLTLHGGAEPSAVPAGINDDAKTPPLAERLPASVLATPRTPNSLGRVLASPLARRLAAETGTDLRSLVGTGPNNRIRKRDIAMSRRDGAGGAAEGSPAQGTPTRQTLSSMRARIADTVAASRRSIPSYSLDRWVTTTKLNAERRRLSADSVSAKITVTDMLLQAVADVLVTMPSFLDRWIEGASPAAVTASSSVDIALVVAVSGGLLIPVIGNLAHKDLSTIARVRHEAVERARSGRLSAADSVPAAIAISNLGKSGVDRFEAIINPGQTSILAIGREHERALATDGKLYAATGMNMTLSVDHRLIDGRNGADFLGRLAERIENGSWRSN